MKIFDWNLQQSSEHVKSSLGQQGVIPSLRQVIKRNHTDSQNLLAIGCPTCYWMPVFLCPYSSEMQFREF